MKVCKSCGFDNPDSYSECVKCGDGLPMTIEQSQKLSELKKKLTDSSIHDEDEKKQMENSWEFAMRHRFDKLWELGRRIFLFQNIFGAVMVLVLAVLVMVGTIYMVESLN